jgi:hypothetical protein
MRASSDLGQDHNIHCPRFQYFGGGRRPFVDEPGDHHHRQGMLSHQFPQKGQAIHARSIRVEKDDVGDFVFNKPRTREGVRGGSHHLQARILRHDFRKYPANSSGAGDNENPENAQLASSRMNIVGPTARNGSFRSAMLPSEWPRKRYPPGLRQRQRWDSTVRCVALSK